MAHGPSAEKPPMWVTKLRTQNLAQSTGVSPLHLGGGQPPPLPHTPPIPVEVLHCPSASQMGPDQVKWYRCLHSLLCIRQAGIRVGAIVIATSQQSICLPLLDESESTGAPRGKGDGEEQEAGAEKDNVRKHQPPSAPDWGVVGPN